MTAVTAPSVVTQLRVVYNDDVVRKFTIAAIFWGVVGFAVGVLIAWQLAFPALNLDLEWTTFGRLRLVHTSAVIFAFGGNALLGTSFYVLQRTCRTPLWGGPRLPTSSSGAIRPFSSWRQAVTSSALPRRPVRGW